jgi:hypothetical protein
MAKQAPRPPKKRAINEYPGSPIGMQRYGLHKQAYARIEEAKQQGFYLEAITLIESLISDRLESRLSRLLTPEYGFQTLGSLINSVRQVETDEALKTFVTTRVDEWRTKRNSSLHELAKLSEGDERTWEERTIDLPLIAVEGLILLRLLDKHTKRLARVV